MLERSTIQEYNAHGGWYMSEHEEQLNIGRLIEEMNHAKEKLNHVNEKLRQAHADWTYVSQPNVFQVLHAAEGKIIIPPGGAARAQAAPRSLEGLLSYHELLEVLEEKQRWTAKYNEAATSLRTLAPHLSFPPS